MRPYNNLGDLHYWDYFFNYFSYQISLLFNSSLRGREFQKYPIGLLQIGPYKIVSYSKANI